MTQPHRCPVCEGRGMRPKEGKGKARGAEDCPACNGRGIVWEPDGPAVITSPPKTDEAYVFPPVTTYEPEGTVVWGTA